MGKVKEICSFKYDSVEDMESCRDEVKPKLIELYKRYGFVVFEVVSDIRINMRRGARYSQGMTEGTDIEKLERTDIKKPVRSREYWIGYWKSMNKKLGFEHFKWVE